MKLLFVMIVFLSACLGVVQDQKQSNTPIQILYGTRTSDERRHGPIHSGVLNMKVVNDLVPAYPEKAKNQDIQGRVEVQLLVNEDGEVIFANPLSGPEELWAESVKASVKAQFTPMRLSGKPVKITGRVIFDFTNGEAVLVKFR